MIEGNNHNDFQKPAENNNMIKTPSSNHNA